MKRTGIGLFLLSLAASSSAAPGPDLHWLTGCWQTEAQTLREQWSAKEGGYLFGYAVTYQAGEAVFFEQMRIETAPQPVFYAYPNGSGPFAFPAVEQASQTLIFANPEHDYPQRIDYQRLQDKLVAKISLNDGTQARTFTYHPCDEPVS